jgi:hypothetical protein
MQPIVIRITDMPEESRVNVDVLEFGQVAENIDFEYEHPSARCSGNALDRAISEATHWMDHYSARGYSVELKQDY